MEAEFNMPEGAVTFTIEVINKKHSSPKVTYDNVKAVDGENLYQAMCTLEKIRGCGFSFKSKEVRQHLNHHFIAKINDLSEDVKNSLYWKIFKGDETNPMPQTVDLMHPKQGEKYIFAYDHTPEKHGNKA